jgi:hypothetical protein
MADSIKFLDYVKCYLILFFSLASPTPSPSKERRKLNQLKGAEPLLIPLMNNFLFNIFAY